MRFIVGWEHYRNCTYINQFSTLCTARDKSSRENWRTHPGHSWSGRYTHHVASRRHNGCWWQNGTTLPADLAVRLRAFRCRCGDCREEVSPVVSVLAYDRAVALLWKWALLVGLTWAGWAGGLCVWVGRLFFSRERELSCMSRALGAGVGCAWRSRISALTKPGLLERHAAGARGLSRS
jgi:hypothetical protein